MVEIEKPANLSKAPQLESVFTPNAALLRECAKFAESSRRLTVIEKYPLISKFFDSRYGNAWREYVSSTHSPEDASATMIFNQNVYSHLANMCYDVGNQVLGKDIHQHLLLFWRW
jgi:hypothetical protein